MADWFNSLATIDKIFWGIAIVSSFAFLIILIITFFVGDTDTGDVDADVEADVGAGFQFFTLKGLISFFTIFGWMAIFLRSQEVTLILNLGLSVLAGAAMMLVMAALFYYISKLTSSGTLEYKNALNQVGEVYQTIGANRRNIGKVQIRVQGTLRDMDAITNCNNDLRQGTVIIVEEVTNNGVLIVKPNN